MIDMDKMELKGMRFFGYHGVIPEENRLGQQFYVDVVLYLDLTVAGRTDDLEATVNYAEVYGEVKKIVEGPPFKLIEALTEHIAQMILATYTKVSETVVRVTKPHPPFDVHFDGVTTEIRRKRESHE